MERPPHPGAKLCECGCGLPAPIAKVTSRSQGTTRGYPRRFISGHNISGARAPGYSHSEEARAKIRAKRAGQQNVSGIAPHGMSKTPTYKSWASMLWRCRDPRDASYPRYGGRGIAVCDRWDPRKGGSFVNFLADMGERPEGMTLDRINGDGNYVPENCRWATLQEQTTNRPTDNGWNARRSKQHH